MSEPVMEKRTRLSDPVVTAGDRVYSISSQNGLFPDPWGGHVPREMWGIWDHPIKLFDGVWFGIRPQNATLPTWLAEAVACGVYPGYTEFEYMLDRLRVVRRDFIPDGVEGMVVTLTVYDPEQESGTLEAIALFRSDLRPAWLGEQTGMQDGKDDAHYEAGEGYVVFKDGANPWTAIAGAIITPDEVAIGDDIWAIDETAGRGISARMTFPLTFTPERETTLTCFIAGSAISAAEAIATYGKLRTTHADLFAEKKAQYLNLYSQSELVSPDPLLNDAFQWSKLNCRMLARNVPSIGLCAGAGMPEYPWWFGIDTEYAVLPMLQAGLFDLTKESLRLLLRVSQEENANEPGRVIHELSTTGVVYNPGNIVETPAFIRAVHQCWLWTGDRAFLEEMYDFCKQGLLDYALGTCDSDGDLCPSGRSIIETLDMHAGFECIDPAAYTWEALGRLADMAEAMGDHALIPDLQHKAQQLGKCIRDEWWMPEEGLFADVRASVDEVECRLHEIEERVINQEAGEDARRQARQARQYFAPWLERRADAPRDVDLPWLLRHWVVICPVEVGLATPEQAQRLLQRLESPEFSGEWGLYLHPLRQVAMSINTGIMALAEARYGRTNQALRIVRKLAEAVTYRMPGAISEALPDRWCFIQLWSALGVISPVVEFFLGISPRAAEHKLRVVPNLPAGIDSLQLHQLRAGETHFDISVERSSSKYSVRLSGDDPGYQIEVGVYLPADTNVSTTTLNGAQAEGRWERSHAGRALVFEARGQADIEILLG